MGSTKQTMPFEIPTTPPPPSKSANLDTKTVKTQDNYTDADPDTNGSTLSSPVSAKGDTRPLNITSVATGSSSSGRNRYEPLDSFEEQGHGIPYFNGAPVGPGSRAAASDVASGPYRTYKRRFFGLLQLTLLNIIVSWDWLTFAPVSVSSAQFFDTSETAINWLSTGFLFAFVVATPPCMWVLNRHGPKMAIVISSLLILVGNWIRYAGARSNEHGGAVFGLVVFGQMLIGLAQPFVLSTPTRYSDLWFTERGRIAATALASLANPFGGALGQLIDRFWVSEPSQVPDMVLYVAIISTIATLPSLFIPAAPPSPPCASASLAKPALSADTLRALLTNRLFYLIALPFALYVSTFNAISSLLNQILYPYGYTENAAGVTGALLILVGLASAAVASPILDRYKRLGVWFLRLVIPIIAAGYVAFIFVPWTRGLVAPYVVASVIGAGSFVLLPFALELLVDITHPVSPEVSSSVCWAAGQLGGGLLIISMNALRRGSAANNPVSGGAPDSAGNSPEGNMTNSLILQAVVAVCAVPAPLFFTLIPAARRILLGQGGGRREMDMAAC